MQRRQLKKLKKGGDQVKVSVLLSCPSKKESAKRSEERHRRTPGVRSTVLSSYSLPSSRLYCCRTTILPTLTSSDIVDCYVY